MTSIEKQCSCDGAYQSLRESGLHLPYCNLSPKPEEKDSINSPDEKIPNDNVVSSGGTTFEHEWEKELDEIFPAEEMEPDYSNVVIAEPSKLKSFIASLLSKAREEERQRILAIIDENAHCNATGKYLRAAIENPEKE